MWKRCTARDRGLCSGWTRSEFVLTGLNIEGLSTKLRLLQNCRQRIPLVINGQHGRLGYTLPLEREWNLQSACQWCKFNACKLQPVSSHVVCKLVNGA